ncbi:stress-response A/B barrel domain-containing protein HS1-like [Silene latifolia]|uniref:stress-response A/B barrel domain-containing protein HS1-like n=1 Tax=Silene latifolia TaxID=37657 RepID=UPI003D76D5D8
MCIIKDGKMSNGKGVVKHVLLAKLKDDLSPDKIEEYINSYADLINHIPLMKSFVWGKDVSIGNRHQGFTHIFESTFESTEAVAEYVVHEKHVMFVNRFQGYLEKVLIIDYKPTSFSL